MMSAEKRAENWAKRTKLVRSDPNNKYIPRVPNAGQTVDGYQVMHNSLLVEVGGYYGKHMENMLRVNKGSHEPQEERAFAELLQWVKPGSAMIELGSFWAFYSMWFYQQVPNAHCYLVEKQGGSKGDKRFRLGKDNFKKNGMTCTGLLGEVGDQLTVDSLLDRWDLDRMAILHSDIQGAEVAMLKGARQAIAKQAIDYFVISVHGRSNYARCLDMLAKTKYREVVNISPAESYCADGILIYRSSLTTGPDAITVIPRNKKG